MPLSRTVKRRIFALGLPLLLVGGFKAWMYWGPRVPGQWSKVQDAFGKTTPVPGAPPALFPWHAEWILKGELGFPRALEGFIPMPEKGSNAAIQLMGMGWWDGSHWTPTAIQFGTPEGRGLRLPLGKLTVAEVEQPTPARDYNGPELCQVDFKVRWELEEELYRVMQVEHLIALRRPARLEIEHPGGIAPQQITLERNGMGFQVWKVEEVRTELPGRPTKGRSWWRWFL